MRPTIKVAGTDITDLVILKTAKFISQVNGAPGSFTIQVRDTGHSQVYTTGQEITVDLGADRVFGGFVTMAKRQFPLPVMKTVNKAKATPRYWNLVGVDYNILFQKRVIYDPVNPASHVFFDYALTAYDDTVIKDLITNASDLVTYDGLSLDGVQRVAPAFYDVKGVTSGKGTANAGTPASAGYTVRDMLYSIGRETGAVFYIRPLNGTPRMELDYVDVDTLTSDLVLNDQPTGPNDIGYQDLWITNQGSDLRNDALVWGAALGASKVVFSRTQDDTPITGSIAVHGRWQVGLYSQGLYKQASADLVSNSYVYGTLHSLRGGKDDAVSFECSVFNQPLVPAMVMRAVSAVEDYDDTLPIRKMTMTFPTPNDTRMDLVLSWQPDQPWSIFETLWPSLPTIKLPGFPGFTPTPGGCGSTDTFDRSDSLAGWGVSTSGISWKGKSNSFGFPFKISGSTGIMDVSESSVTTNYLPLPVSLPVAGSVQLTIAPLGDGGAPNVGMAYKDGSAFYPPPYGGLPPNMIAVWGGHATDDITVWLVGVDGRSVSTTVAATGWVSGATTITLLFDGTTVTGIIDGHSATASINDASPPLVMKPVLEGISLFGGGGGTGAALGFQDLNVNQSNACSCGITDTFTRADTDIAGDSNIGGVVGGVADCGLIWHGHHSAIQGDQLVLDSGGDGDIGTAALTDLVDGDGTFELPFPHRSTIVVESVIGQDSLGDHYESAAFLTFTVSHIVSGDPATHRVYAGLEWDPDGTLTFTLGNSAGDQVTATSILAQIFPVSVQLEMNESGGFLTAQATVAGALLTLDGSTATPNPLSWIPPSLLQYSLTQRYQSTDTGADSYYDFLDISGVDYCLIHGTTAHPPPPGLDGPPNGPSPVGSTGGSGEVLIDTGDELTYRTKDNAYIPGSTQVMVNGLKQVNGTNYVESHPKTGQITFKQALAPADQVTMTYVTAGANTAPPPVVSGDIQALIDAASPGDTVDVPIGTYPPQTVNVNKAITLTATPGTVIIDCQGQLSYCLKITADGAVVNGIYVTNVDNPIQTGAISLAANATVSNCQATYCFGSGIKVERAATSGWVVEDSQFNYNRQEGYSCNGSNGTFLRCQFNYNNPNLAVDPGFEAGGGKTASNTDGVIFDSCEAAYNGGPGIWFDLKANNSTVRFCRSHHNWVGVMFEISDGLDCHDNAIWENGWQNTDQTYGWPAGILISSSANAHIYNNTLGWNDVGISVISQRRGEYPTQLPISGNYIHDNVVVSSTHPQGGGVGLRMMGFYADYGTLFSDSSNHGLNNQFYAQSAEPTSDRFEYAGQLSTIAAFAATVAGTGSTYMTSGAAAAALASAGIPATPEHA